MFRGGHLVTLEQRGKYHLGAVTRSGEGRVMRNVAADNMFRLLVFRQDVDLAEAASNRDNVDGGIATPDTDDFTGGDL